MPSSADLVAPFLQDPPRPVDLFAADPALQLELQRRLPAEVWERVRPALAKMGELTKTELWHLQRASEAQLPQHVPYDSWGRRVDRIDVSPAWEELHRVSARQAIVATGYDATLGVHARTVQAALIHLFSASSAIYSCPLAMTDACARVLTDMGPTDLQSKWLPRLLSRDPATFVTSGQWMTERTGGSDVGYTETVARPIDGSAEHFTLHGIKWFTSAATSDVALTLARIDDGQSPPVPGSRGLTMFLVEVERDEGGVLLDIEVRRLKDKLGTKSLPTAELSLEGVKARRIGPVGRGVPCISAMLNITRYWNAASSSSAVAQAAMWAADYAQRRVAFGRTIAEHPLHRRLLEELEAEAAGTMALVLELAGLMGKVEHGTATEDESKRLRALLPIAKLTTGKQAVWGTSEGLEAFGGAGYMEDTGLPRMLRDAQTLPIWEGTTNVLSLDVLRAEHKEGGLSAVVRDLGCRLAALDIGALGAAGQQMTGLFTSLTARLAALAADGDRARMEWEARRISMTTGLLCEALYLAETAQASGDAGARRRFERLVGLRLTGPLG